MKYKLLVNGFENTVYFSGDELEHVHRFLLSHLSALYRMKKQRILCLYAAPPGVGKSTNVALWELLSRKYSDLEEVQSLSIDGFHYSNQFLASTTIVREGKTISLKSIKGAPETYDVELLKKSVLELIEGTQVHWPYYDRNIHDPIPNVIQVTSPILIIEGNWVLLEEGIWSQLKDYATFTIYQDADESILKKRLIERKIRGKFSIQEAESHYDRSDSHNIQRVREHHGEADAYIVWNKDLNSWTMTIQ